MTNNIPIIIPFKEHSIRCPNKNFILFPYVFRWLKIQNIDLESIYVISESEVVKTFIKSYNINFLYEQHNTNTCGDVYSAYNAACQLNCEKYITLPLTQPIRNNNLISEIKTNMFNNNYDFITTYQLITDRSLFYINNENAFITKSINRKGCLCNEVKMIDGAIYGMTRQFIERIITSDDLNRDFWNGKFKTIHNDVDIFLDIDTRRDLNLFLKISDNYIQ